MVAILVLENIWWPFGSHMLNTKYEVMYAINNGIPFYYKNNNALVFQNGLLTTYFEDFSQVTEEDLHNKDNEVFYGPDAFQRSPYCKNMGRLYFPSDYPDLASYHQSVLRMIYRPNAMVKEYVENCHIIQSTRDMKYIGLHIRMGDKTQGPGKETNSIPVETYMEKCLKARDSTGISNLVVCSDTSYALEEVQRINTTLEYPFTIHYNQEEKRSQNTWQDAVVVKVRDNRMSAEEAKQEYLTCFVNFELLLRSEIAVGNFDSGFIYTAVEMRNNGKDMNVAEHPPMFSP
jgi:hypothetical protein